MKILLQIAVGSIALAAAAASAQSLNGAKLAITSIDLTGASSLHKLSVAVDTNNAITATGTRYDIAAGEVSFNPAEGTAVTALAGSATGAALSTTNATTVSRVFRNPRTRANQTVTLTNTVVTTMTPFGIQLDDASQIKGTVTTVSSTFQDARISLAGAVLFSTCQGQSRSKLDGAIAFEEKTGNFSSGAEPEHR